ncbi:hypothetical protein Syun_009455 [Stephania yunnanensis]|uniref:Uncharacterized protein n=1 Tax=Stephania yunnanensis TaxID=152371 RepID=A0AAP0KEG9_9MAGN
MSEARHDLNMEQPAKDYDGLCMEESELAFMGAILLRFGFRELEVLSNEYPREAVLAETPVVGSNMVSWDGAAVAEESGGGGARERRGVAQWRAFGQGLMACSLHRHRSD